jgi:hypothetical protein
MRHKNPIRILHHGFMAQVLAGTASIDEIPAWCQIEKCIALKRTNREIKTIIENVLDNS